MDCACAHESPEDLSEGPAFGFIRLGVSVGFESVVAL